MSHIDPDERVRRALGFLAVGEAAHARRQCEKVLALMPGHFDARHLLGAMALRAGRPHEALHQLTQAVRLAPGEAQARSNLATALRLAGRFPEAETEARQAVEREPGRGEYVANLAQTLGELGRWDEALVLFRWAAELAPALGGLHYDIGRTLNRLERYPEAERAVRDALAAAPAHRAAAVELGLVLTGQQRQVEAVTWYEGWLAHDPEAHGIAFNLGQLYAEQDRHAEARIVFSLRHPYDVCLSCLMQNFVDNPAIENFRDAQRTVVLYERIMSLWVRLRASFALTVFTVYTNRYEDLARDPTRGVRALAEFFGLAFEPAMLDSAGRAQQHARIRTASYAQVVNPINRAALGRFQHYLPYLLPTFHRLDRFVGEFGYAPVDDSVEASS